MDNFVFKLKVGVQEYTCTLTRSISGKKSEAKYQAYSVAENNIAPGKFVVTMTFTTAKGVVYSQAMTGHAAASMLSKKKCEELGIPTADEAMDIPFDVRFVKRMAKRAMEVRLESLRLDGKRKAAYSWTASKARRCIPVTIR